MVKISCYIYLYCSLCFLISGCAAGQYRQAAHRQIREAEAELQHAQKLEAPIYAPETYLEAQLIIRQAWQKMRSEKFGEAKSLAHDARGTAEEAQEESREESMRIRALAARLLFNGRETWNRYAKGDEKQYALDLLIGIKTQLDDGYRYLENDRFMDALESAQSAHQKLALLPKVIEKGIISQLEEKNKLAAGQKSADQIIKAVQQQAAEIIKNAREQAQKVLVESQVRAAEIRMGEFERIYPSTYKVKKGETVIDIAMRREIFNDQFMWPLIYKANRDQIRDPKVVFPDQVLAIPRDITFEEIIEARKQAEAPPPYIPPPHAYNPEFYRRYLMIVPEEKVKQ